MSEKNKVIVKYIPAGAKITVVENLDMEVFGGTKRKKKIGQTSSQNAAEMQNGPPKTICKNNSLKFEDFNVLVNEKVDDSWGFICDNTKTEQDILPVRKVSLVEKLKQLNTKATNSSEGKASEGSKKFSPSKLLQTIKQTKACCHGNCNKFTTCSMWISENLKFPGDATKLPLFKQNIFEKIPILVKKFNSKIVLHGPIIPRPAFQLDKTFIDENIKTVLAKLDCTVAKELQSYIWIAVQRGLNIFAIGPRNCGKTLGYLPGICTFSLNREKYGSLTKYAGPLVLILCLNPNSCEDLLNLATKLLSRSSGVSVEVLTEENYTTCDILISVPPILENAVKSGRVHLSKVCHLVIEDGDALLKNHTTSMENIFKVLNEIERRRPESNNIQLIVNSDKWSTDLEVFLRKMYVCPVVCFEDFLEAAFYSKLKFWKKKLNSAHKIFYLNDILKKTYLTHKTVIFCNETDIEKMCEHFQIFGIEYVAISNSLIEDEIFENEDIWNSLPLGQFKVLLCTDSVFEKTVNVLSAHWLIHYTIPSNWVDFQKRFRCLLANFTSPLEIEAGETPQLTSFVIIDEQCDSRFILDFFEILTRISMTSKLTL